MDWEAIAEIDVIADYLVGLVAQVREGLVPEPEDVLLAAWNLGRCRDRAGARLEVCTALLAEVIRGSIDRLEFFAYRLSDVAAQYTGPAGYYSLTSVLDERSGFEFIAELTGLRLDTEELDRVLTDAQGDAPGFPDRHPEGVPASHWWWTYEGTCAERQRREALDR